MARTERLGEFARRIQTHVLVLLVVLVPFAPFWYLVSTTDGSLTVSGIAVAVSSGTVLLSAGAHLVAKYTSKSATAILVFDGVPLGFNAGSSLSDWAGFSEDISVVVGLASALVLTLGLLDYHDGTA
ncbi:hypothetical protein [Halorussus sp. MSC15.2]|uniref:hypothetical protein n=1 Tax=Halorussus sp. MSC15.2 TaxID=2283638 RepID=UPI0013D864C7|nr:hypothetical protein [Halorussus sp. MSC15.2]NEU56390.1 hypothetical protein [Halorussus sp. MSC15.2]